MTAVTDIAALTDGGLNPISEIRTALTSVLGRADIFQGATMTKSATQAIPTATETAITFDGEDFDTDGFHDNAVNPARFSIPAGAAGVYLLGGSVELNNLDAGDFLILRLEVNGTTILPGRGRFYGDGSGVLPGSFFSAPTDLAEGDYVELTAEHNKGSNADARTSANGTSFWGMKIGVI